MSGPDAARLSGQAFHLYRVALHPELLEVARQESLRGERLRARACLLTGGGHWLEVRADRDDTSAALTTILGPLDLELPTLGRIELSALADRDLVVLRERSRLEYEGGYQVERCGADYEAKVAHLEHPPAQGWRRLRRQGGHPENPGPRPFSLLDLRLQDGVLEAYGVEAFPEDRCLVLSHARFRAG